MEGGGGTVHIDIYIRVCDVTVHRQRERALLLLLGRETGLGLYAFSIDMLFWGLVFICYKC